MNIVKNPKIRELLYSRWKDLGMKVSDVIKDANERGIKVNAARMSRYKNANHKECISPEQLLWLCTRWGIFINLNIGEPVLEKGKLSYKVLPYNEEKCLKKLELLYGKK